MLNYQEFPTVRMRSKLPLLLLGMFVPISAIFIVLNEPAIAIIFSAFVLTICGIDLMLQRQYGSYRFLTLLVSSCYLFAGPIDLFFFNNVLQLNEESLALSTYYGSLFLLAFLAIATGAQAQPASTHLIEIQTRKANAAWGKLGMVFGALLLAASIMAYTYGIYVATNFQIGTLLRGEFFLESNTAMAIARQMLVGYFIAQFCYFHKQTETVFKALVLYLPVFIFFSGEVLFLGDRKLFLMLALAVFCARVRSENLYRYLIVGALTIVLFYLWAFFRNTPIEDWEFAARSLNSDISHEPGTSEFGRFSLIFQDVTEPDWLNAAGPTFFDSIMASLPRILPFDRPLAGSQWYVQEFDPLTAAIGGGWAFNLVADAWLSGWFLGPILAGTLVGFMGRYFAAKDLPSHPGLGNAFAVAVFVFMFRADIPYFLKTIVSTGIGVFIAILLTGVDLNRQARR